MFDDVGGQSTDPMSIKAQEQPYAPCQKMT